MIIKLYKSTFNVENKTKIKYLQLEFRCVANGAM
jgi:hypothetical protein